MKIVFAATIIAFSASQALAGCPGRAPGKSWNMHSGDQKVGASFLQKTLVGKRLRYRIGGDTGTEHFHANGTYVYELNSDDFQAPSYKFYANGVRCIDYDKPRFDRYVVNGGKIVLINWQGGRYEGQLLN